VGLSLVKGIGAVRFHSLLNYFGDAESVWKAAAKDLRSAGLSANLVQKLLEVRAAVDLEKVWDGMRARGITVLTWEDQDYPRRLKELDQHPPVLYVRGEIRSDDEWSVAVVGTRRVTAYGRQVANDVASILAASGVTIVSGLARGIDGIAHQAALKAGGRTIAVLGSGVDRVYPPEHRRLAQEIVEAGALVSDYPPGTPPDGSNFPPRNRIISGLSLAVIVVEAGQRSGALITAKFAAEQGRDVFAVPGNINAPQSVGANKLIQQGARPLLSPADVLEMLDLTMVHEQQDARRSLPMDPTETKLLSVLSQEPMHVDEIRNRVTLPIEQVSSTLALMELKGMVRHVGGMNYISLREVEGDYQV